jgi:hypothetical protein
MILAKKIINYTMLSVAIILGLTRCSDDEVFSVTKTAYYDTKVKVNPIEEDITSISITGIYTVVDDKVDCSACTYVVSEEETFIDGDEAGIQPGSIICLKRSSLLNSIEFTNITGTSEFPVVIGICID